MIDRRKLVQNCKYLLHNNFCGPVAYSECPFQIGIIKEFNLNKYLDEIRFNKFNRYLDHLDLCIGFHLDAKYTSGLVYLEKVLNYLNYEAIDQIEELLND